MYFLTSLNSLNVNTNIITLFYNSTISLVLNYCIIAFYHVLSSQLKNFLNRPWKRACKITKDNRVKIIEHSILCTANVAAMTAKIMNDESHLSQEFVFLKSGRHLNVPYIRTNRYGNSFVPKAIKIFNAAK